MSLLVIQGIEFSSCTCSSLETSCSGMRISRKVRFSKERTGFFVVSFRGSRPPLGNYLQHLLLKINVLPITLLHLRNFHLLFCIFYFKLIIFLITNILVRYFFSFSLHLVLLNYFCKVQNATSCNANMQTPNYITDIREQKEILDCQPK